MKSFLWTALPNVLIITKALVNVWIIASSGREVELFPDLTKREGILLHSSPKEVHMKTPLIF